MVVGRSARLCFSRSSGNSALRSKNSKECASAIHKNGGQRPPLQFLVADICPKFAAGETDGKVVADRDLGGIADDVALGVARDRVAAAEDGERSSFLQESFDLGEAVSALREQISELGREFGRALVECRALQPHQAPKVVAHDALRSRE